MSWRFSIDGASPYAKLGGVLRLGARLGRPKARGRGAAARRPSSSRGTLTARCGAGRWSVNVARVGLSGDLGWRRAARVAARAAARLLDAGVGGLAQSSPDVSLT